MYLRACGYPLVSVFVVLDRDTVGAISVEIWPHQCTAEVIVFVLLCMMYFEL